MKRLMLGLLACLFACSQALAQCAGSPPQNYVCAGAASGPAGFRALTAADLPALPGITAPTVQRLLSGSGTYTSPAGVTRLRVKMKAAGGGGQGASATFSTPNSGGVGANSTFENWVAVGGGAGGGGGQGGTGGVNGTGTLIDRTPGATAQIGGGWTGLGGSVGIYGRSGAGSGGGLAGSGGAPGNNAQPNSGAGGAGGGPSAGSAGFFGAGGSEGETVEFWIAPGSYNYSVGAGGQPALAAGTNTQWGSGAGGSGKIIVEEHY